MNTPPDNVIKLSDFFIREKANDGVDFPLPLPNGDDSGHTIKVRGIDSDHMRLGLTARQRVNARIACLPEAEQDEARLQADLDLLIEMVAGWSLPEECTPENVRTLLRENPIIRELVDQSALKRKAFFGSRSQS